MLLKCCVIILILCLKMILLCDAVEKSKGKMNKNCIENNIVPFNINAKRYKKHKKLALSIKGNSTANRLELGGVKGRYLNKYFVMTGGGHVLSTFRLTFEETKERAEKCPVLLVHGLFQSSDRFFIQDKEQSLALKLQDLGYDVWLANMRANKYNRVHMFFEPDKDDFEKNRYFSYSYEELGTLDIAATVDFILTETTHKQLLYIGHSLGGTAFLVLNSLIPEYNSKFSTAYLFAPLGYHSYFSNDILKAEAKRSKEIHSALFNESTFEIFPYADEDAKFTPEDCLGNKSYSNVCDQLNIQIIMGLRSTNNNVDETRGGSIGPLIHLAQNVRSGTFSRWDFGELENLKRYKTSSPPKYNLGLVTVPTEIIYASNDEFVSPKDIALMASDMVNAKTRNVKRTSFKHEDFIIGSDAMENVYAGIIDDMKKSTDLCHKNQHGFLFYLLQYKWILISIIFIVLLFIIAIILLDCNRRTHNTKHCTVG